MTPIDVYKTYLAFKNHFTKKSYNYFKYGGKSKASVQAYNKRKDRYFFERMSRKKTDEEIKDYFLANFVECDDPDRLWIGEIISSGEDNLKSWMKRSQTMSYMFKTEVEVFVNRENFQQLFTIKGQSHPEILKKYLQGALSIETMVILDIILEYVKNFDKKLEDPVWETVSLKIKKYKPFLNINVNKYKSILKEQVV
tara:strand:+ start:1126 stop:1716 length:591 start_codon:yes stop_codon:yes gene_type:complete